MAGNTLRSATPFPPLQVDTLGVEQFAQGLPPGAQDSGQVLMVQGQSSSHGRAGIYYAARVDIAAALCVSHLQSAVVLHTAQTL